MSGSGVGIGKETMMYQKAPILRGYYPVRTASYEVVVGTSERRAVALPTATAAAPPTAAAYWVFVSLGLKVKNSRSVCDIFGFFSSFRIFIILK